MSYNNIPPFKRDLTVSFEFFPPMNIKAERNLWKTVEKLAPINPDFASVTYGAGGTTQQGTYATVNRLQAHAGIAAASHLTIVGASKHDINQLLLDYKNAGISRIVALRGDTPGCKGEFTAHPDGFQNSVELIEHIQKMGGFDVSVAAYPETHPCAQSEQADITYLKRKMDAGANRAITQFFFEADTFLRFRDKAVAAGVTIPILPGILPVTNYERVVGFAKACSTYIPPWFHNLFKDLDDDAQLKERIAAKVASELALQLNNEGVKDFHLYTLNKWGPATAICSALGLKVNTVTEPRKAA